MKTTMSESMREIMVMAWGIRREYKTSMSVALKAAWAAARIYDSCKAAGEHWGVYSDAADRARKAITDTISAAKAAEAKKEANEAAKTSGIFTSNKKKTCENECFLPKSRTGNGRYVYKYTVLEAVIATDSNGHVIGKCIELVYPQSKTFDVSAKTNTKARVTCEISAGYDGGEFFGINFGNVDKIKGNTYDVKDAIKSLGYHWDKTERCWVR